MAPNTLERSATALRNAAMTYPEAHEDFPWGEVAIKVSKKVFLFMHGTGETLSLSCKLPHSSDMALMLPFAKPTDYGLGKSGWVSASFSGKEEPPLDLLREWIDESYRAVAPKKLVVALAGEGGGSEVKAKTTKARTARKVGAGAAKVGAGSKKPGTKVGAGSKETAAKVGAGSKKTATKAGSRPARGGSDGAPSAKFAAGKRR